LGRQGESSRGCSGKGKLDTLWKGKVKVPGLCWEVAGLRGEGNGLRREVAGCQGGKGDARGFSRNFLPGELSQREKTSF
jgi:hypothetical protein